MEGVKVADELHSEISESEIVPGLNLRYLKAIGLWAILNTYRAKRKRNMVLQVSSLWTLLSITPYFILQCVSYFYITIDIEKAAMIVLNPLTCIQTLLKMFVFWSRLDEQNRLLSLMKKNYLKSTPVDKTSETEEILKNVAIQTSYLSNLAIFVNFSCVLVWNFLPIIRTKAVVEAMNFPSSFIVNDTISNKVLAGWYPFEYTKSPGYEIVYVYEFLICAWAGFVVTAHEILLAQTVMMLYGQISVLGFNLETLKAPLNYSTMVELNKKKAIKLEYRNNPKPIKYGTTEEIEVQMYDRLLLCLKDHQRLMHAADEVKNLYNIVITLQLLTGGMIMIFSAFHFVFGVKDLLLLLKFSIYLAYAMVEIILYCYSGGLLETVSEDVTQAAYRSDWYLSSKRFKKTMQMIMVRNTRPQTLIAGRLYPVNLITLSNLLQLTYSTSALLSRLNDGYEK